MANKYVVTATFPDGTMHTLSTCCERDAVGRFAMLGRAAVLDQPAGLPRTCEAHRYEGEASR